MHFATSIPDWNSLESVRRAHSDLEAAALVFFALLVLFDILANLSKDQKKRTLLEKCGLCFFAVAVLAEIAAYPYGQRNDALSAEMIGSLNIEAGNAAESAKTAQSEADAVNKEADAISVRLGNDSKQLDKVEERVSAQGPRWELLNTGKEELVRSLKPYAGQKILVTACESQLTEPMATEMHLGDSLGSNQVDWKVRESWANCVPGGSDFTGWGILILTSAASEKAVKDAAGALSETLLKLNISSIHLEVDASPNSLALQIFGANSPWVWAHNDPTEVVVVVGDNPMWDREEIAKQHPQKPRK
jgi:hypothetical protein